MKKTLVSALTTALVVGAASTTFAAANPFEDVPADHWAYDAVAQLAADGVIEGYGDGTYRGDQEITRYEMAQMIARAMAKNPNGADKALVDKLAAEFADELNNLGVRVAALEKKVDNVKWGGRVRYRYIHMNHEGGAPGQNAAGNGPAANNDRANVNQILLRFEPQMKINEHWTGKARIDYGAWNNMDTAKNDTSVTVDRIWVQGDYKNLQIHLGKLTYATKADYGLIMNRYITGGSVIIGKDVKVALSLGRVYDDQSKVGSEYALRANNPGTTGYYIGADADGNSMYDTSSYGAIEVYNDRSKRFTWGIGYHQFRNLRTMRYRGTTGAWNEISNDDNYGIFNIGLGYKFTKDLKLTGAWARATNLDAANGFEFDSAAKNSYAFQLDYKGADAKKVNSWGAYVAWRSIGNMSSTGWTQYSLNGPQYTGSRGFEIGASWTPMKNVVGKLSWFTGKDIKTITADTLAGREKVNTIFTEWSFIF